MPIRVQLRNDSSTNWTAKNPILLSGEIGIESDSRYYKIGDGATRWNSLSYGGMQGLQGEKGEKGEKGEPGTPGIQGPTGAQGEKGETGATGPSATWGTITGTLSSQTDLAVALAAKASSTHTHDPVCGTATLDANGEATVANAAVTTAARVFLARQSGNSNMSIRVSAVVAGVSFTITSAGGADDSGLEIGWMII